MITVQGLPGSPSFRPNTATHTVKEYKPRAGLLRAEVGAKFLIDIITPDKRTARMYVTVQDRTLYPHATGRLVCLHKRCAGKSWESEAKMHADHPSATQMDRDGEAHVFAAWSDSPVLPDAAPDPGCSVCIGEKGKAPKACITHAGGVVGLISTGEAS